MKDIIYREKLNDNVNCCCRQTNSSDFQIALVVQTGSIKEVRGQSGIAHCMEHINLLWDKHNPDTTFYGHGYTNYFETVYIIHCKLKNYKKAIQVIGNIMSGVYITQDYVDEAISDVSIEIEHAEQKSAEICRELYSNDLFLEKLPVGKMSDVRMLNLEKINNFYLKRYLKSNMSICIVSSLDPVEYIELVKKRVRSIAFQNNDMLYLNLLRSDKCIIQMEPRKDGNAVVLYKNVNLDLWLPSEIKLGYDFFLDILRINLYECYSRKYNISGITCSLKKFYQQNRILKIRIVLRDATCKISQIKLGLLDIDVTEKQMNKIKDQYEKYKCNEHIFLNNEDFLKECIDEVIGSEKIILIDDERKLINKLLNLSGLEINNYIKKLLNGIRFV